MKYIKLFDIISTEAKFTFTRYGSTRNRTFLGGFLTILLIIASFFLAFLFSKKYLQKDNNIIYTTYDSSNVYNYSLSSSIPFLFKLTSTNNNNSFNINSLFSINMFYIYSNSNQNEFNEIIPIEQCNINKHLLSYKDLFKNINDLHLYYCPVIRNYNQTIYGNINNKESYGYYHFIINKTFSNNIELNINLDFLYIDYDIITNNPHRTKTPYYKKIHIPLNTFSHKHTYIYLKHIQTRLDKGTIFSKIKTDNFFQCNNNIHNDIILYNTTNNIINEISIQGLTNGEIIYIKYIKLHELVAEIGGVIHFLLQVVYILNFSFSMNCYSLKTMSFMEGFNINNNSTKNNCNHTMKTNTNIINGSNYNESFQHLKSKISCMIDNNSYKDNSINKIRMRSVISSNNNYLNMTRMNTTSLFALDRNNTLKNRINKNRKNDNENKKEMWLLFIPIRFLLLFKKARSKYKYNSLFIEMNRLLSVKNYIKQAEILSKLNKKLVFGNDVSLTKCYDGNFTRGKNFK